MSFNIDDIKKLLKEIKSRPSGTLIVLLIFFGVTLGGFYIKGYLVEKGKQSARDLDEEVLQEAKTHGPKSPAINTGPNSQVSVVYDNDSEQMPVLVVRPISFEPYFPSSPQAPGQFKAKITAEIALKNKKVANNIRVKFDISDGTTRRVNSDEWDAIAKQKPLVFSMTDQDIGHTTWTPDIPNAIKEIAQNRKKPFILRLIVTWEDMKGNQYRLKSYSELRYNAKTNKYYFDERENSYI